MGVPAFFRWLTRKYPSVIVHCIEQKTVDVMGVNIPFDSTEPNPNGVEFDNLYLDMNGIIHPCTHPEDKPAPKNEDEMMIAIFECIDRLFRIVRPRKLLFMAIDGVAPRAKMNQQRSRRFRASKEVVEKLNEIERMREELLATGAKLPPPKPKGDHFDSNCITPGTPFMERLAQCLHYYIHDRLNNDPGWKNIKVILSDANVPGEGEHKIMDFIRKQRAQPDHDPNTQHCLCGADADLIMLGLATHEPNFTIIREELKMNQPRPCELCGQLGHAIKECIGLVAEEADVPPAYGLENEFIFVRLNVLREYLERDMIMPNLPFAYDFERVVDDWVFMCFFVGNDFLPHLPSLEIREGAIDRLIRLYKDAVYKTGGWLTNSGDVNLERVQLIMTQLGKAEDAIFKKRQQNELNFKARNKAKKRNEAGGGGFNRNRPNWSIMKNTQFAPTEIGKEKTLTNVRQEAFNIRKAGMHTEARLRSTNAQEALESMLVPVGGKSEDAVNEQRRAPKRKHADDSDEDDQAHDEVRLWEDGFKDRYYESKFDVAPDNLEFRYNVALHYVRGLCWVLRYYYQGCASWKWYFPYHYAPFASDFVNISGLSTEFEMDTKPFNPLEQLMGVFPAASSKHVPQPWAVLMSDPESAIIDLYPEDFKIDLNGKKFAWQGVALLPFVDENRLFAALKPYYKKLTEAEKARNVRGYDRLYLSVSHKSYNLLKAVYDQELDSETSVQVSMEGMQGTILMSDIAVDLGGELNSPIYALPTLEDNSACCVRYVPPQYPRGFIYPATPLKGAKPPTRVLKPEDLDEASNRNWRPQIGMAPSNQRAYVSDAGHRFLNHPPPRDYNNSGGNYHNQRQDNYGGRGGYNNRGGGGGGYQSGSQGGYYQQGNKYGGGGSGGGAGGGYNNRNNYKSNWNNRGGGQQHQAGSNRGRFAQNQRGGRGGGGGGGGSNHGGYQSTGYRR